MVIWKEMLAAAVVAAGCAALIAIRAPGEPRGQAAEFSVAFGPLAAALAVCGVRSWQRRNWHPLKELGVVVAAGVLAGLLLGIVSRVGMRLVAIGAGQSPKFTARGTILVVMLFALFGLSPALVYAALLRRRLPGKGFSYGLLLAALTWYPFARTAAEDLKTTIGDVTVLVSATLFVLAIWVPYALALESALGRLSKRWA